MKVRCPVCKFINQVGKNTAALQCSKCSSALSLYKYQANKRSRPETKTKDSPNDRIPDDADATTISGRTVEANFCRVACQSLSTFTSRVIASSISAILNRVSDFRFMILLKLLVVIAIGFYSVIGYQYFFNVKKFLLLNHVLWN